MPVAEHGPRFASLPETTQREIIKIHKNLGHPDNKLLQRVLKDQNWEPKIVDSIGDFHCPACFETQRPKLARPGHLSEPREFNDLVLIDGIKWTNKAGKQFYFVHMLDAGTNFQIAFLTDDRSSKSMIEGIKLRWFAWAGPPRQLMSDSAGEFCSEEFCQFLQSHNCRSIVIPAEAHWQLGRCERHGSILQHMLEKYEIDYPIDSDDKMTEALVQCTAAKNSLSRYRGYSPEILVLGKASQIPGCNSNEGQDSSFWDPEGDIVHQGESLAFQQNLHRREVARQAFISADHSQKIRRAILRRSRPSRDNFHRGQWVMYWRNGQGQQKGGWNGPAKDPNGWGQAMSFGLPTAAVCIDVPLNTFECLSTRESHRNFIGREPMFGRFHLTTGTGCFPIHRPKPAGIDWSDLSNDHQPTVPDVAVHKRKRCQTNVGRRSTDPSATCTEWTQSRWKEYTDTIPWSARCRTRGECPVPSQQSQDTEPPHPVDGSPSTQYRIPIMKKHTESALTVMWDQWIWSLGTIYQIDWWDTIRSPDTVCFVRPLHLTVQFPLEWLTARRQTEGKFWNHHNWQRNDEWYGNPEVVQNLPLHWFGSTTFFFKPEHRFVRTPKEGEGHVNGTKKHPKFQGIEMSIELTPQELFPVL